MHNVLVNWTLKQRKPLGQKKIKLQGKIFKIVIFVARKF